MTTAVVTQIAYAVQTLFDPAGTVGRLVDLGKLANYGLLTSFTPAYLFTAGINGTWYDPSDINLTWRRNLLTETEFRNGLVDAPIRGGLVSATTLDRYQGAIAFGYDGITTSYAYKSISITALTTYSISVVVEMSDGLAPVFGSAGEGLPVNDFVFVVAADVVSPITYSVKNFDGTLYRVSATYTTPSPVNGLAVGIVKYGANSSRAFKVSAYQLELGSTSTEYQRITDGIQDYLTYQPLPVLYQDAAGTTPVTAVEQPVGLMLDKSKGLVLGPELVTNGDFSQGTTGWTNSSTGTGTFSVSSGAATIIGTDGNNRGAFSQNIGAVAYRFYKVSFNATITSGAGSFFGSGPGSAGGAIVSGANAYYIAAAAGGSFFVYTNSGGGNITIDNISVRELPGNHAFNPSGNSANFPVLSARYNLLTKTGDFSDSVWVKSGATVTTGQLAPDGTNTAAKVVASAGATYPGQLTAEPGSSKTFVGGIWVRGNVGGERVKLDVYQLSVVDNLSNEVVLTTSWQYISKTAAATSASNAMGLSVWNTSGATQTIYIWHPDLRLANDGIGLPAYQRVNTATDYDTVGFKPYLKFNGTNQWLQTNSIDFRATDKMTVFAGVRKLSDAATGMFLESSPGALAGSFGIRAPQGAAARYSFISIGSLSAQVDSPLDYAAPSTNVLTGIGNISGDQSILRVNGTQAAISTTDQGTGNYGNYPLYIGARAGNSLFFNGNLHQLVIAGKQASDSEITATETFINQKTGAY